MAGMARLRPTQTNLLVRLAENSEDAWTEFLAMYERAILGLGRKQGLQDADAQDTMQEVLIARSSTKANSIPRPALRGTRSSDPSIRKLRAF